MINKNYKNEMEVLRTKYILKVAQNHQKVLVGPQVILQPQAPDGLKQANVDTKCGEDAKHGRLCLLLHVLNATD